MCDLEEFLLCPNNRLFGNSVTAGSWIIISPLSARRQAANLPYLWLSLLRSVKTITKLKCMPFFLTSVAVFY